MKQKVYLLDYNGYGDLLLDEQIKAQIQGTISKPFEEVADFLGAVTKVLNT